MTANIILDLSPMLINRTAMFDVCRETAEAFKHLGARHQYFGEIASTTPMGNAADQRRSRLKELMDLSAQKGETALDRRIAENPNRAEAARKVFLDPLYTLFSDLQETDLVLMLDMSPITHPRWHDPAVAKLYRYAFDRISMRRPGLLSISQNTADTFCANYGYPRRPIEVIPLYTPAHLHQAAAKPSLSTRAYFLFVGSLEARKNVKGVIAAFAHSELASQGHWLFIVGGDAVGAEEVVALAAKTQNVNLCGFVDNQDLAALYAGALGFVYPSYLEGFGVPLLEAMHYGLPAVASLTGASSEVGGALVAYCDPDDHLEIAEHLIRISRMTTDERSLLAQRSRARAVEHFSLDGFRRAVTAAAARP